MAAATALLAGGALATATSASATTYDHTYVIPGATLYVIEHGDVFILCDTAADGLAPRTEVVETLPSGDVVVKYQFAASGGNGTCVRHSAAEGGVYDLGEGDTIGGSLWVGPGEESAGSHLIFYSFVNDH